MKNQITKVMVAIVLLASGFLANASENEREIYLKSENSKTVLLQMNHVKEGTHISLWNKAGDLLFQDETLSGSYSKVFNLNLLEKGELILEVESDESLELLPIAVTEDNAEFKVSSERMIAKPLVRLSGNEIKVFLSDGQNNYEMKMTDEFSDVVYKDSIAENKGGIKRYDVSKLPQGKYNIQFTADGRSFYHTIIIE